ncbi:hypothetical protein E2C01_075525 [Portunus trituberculatus]|uniref:Uncharacterized protein n=1 Tax=Portunus trituberculatus TaxID=210409 RepID=A0A5B7IH99_PORTR|nr:hypothetical protein [Portunus trituberculatus]
MTVYYSPQDFLLSSNAFITATSRTYSPSSPKVPGGRSLRDVSAMFRVTVPGSSGTQRLERFLAVNATKDFTGKA